MTLPESANPPAGEARAATTGDPDGLYRMALARTDRSAGFYNHNVRVETREGPVVVRIPIPGTDTMDLTIWPEAGVVQAISPAVARVPRLLHANADPAYQVVEFITGEVLDAVAPRKKRVPDHVIPDVGELFRQLGQVPLDQLPTLPEDWPTDSDTATFAHRLSAVTIDVYTRFRDEFGDLFSSLAFPADPCEPILERWQTLSPRPFRLLHTDIHRKNMIICAGATYFLDWELALWGDPVYDLAVHLHKMAYQPDEENAARTAWRAAVPAEAAIEWTADLTTYLAHERVKSAIVDTVRYTKLITSHTESPVAEAALLDKLTTKLTAAHAVWQTGHTLNRQGVEKRVRASR
ncbi:aminoglycoside phosphotransferase family protein [Frankia sp. AgB32]|uniref:aminoglycoside phosphotransferase family protein n=1 Tax=Frankia sp. AgB32 TaxID=631119 RepID=UPI00200F24D0|nr:aminoglycoside phosphotransferase family protein [Frankia sp. AgB32]MCK9893604.1 aminoglycoside phosphotransferase family protein [Frankia sp. AgB32]